MEYGYFKTDGQQQVKRMLQEHVAEQLVLCTNLRPSTYLDKPNGLEGSAEKQILKRVTGTWIKSCRVVGVPFRVVLVGGFSLWKKLVSWDYYSQYMEK